MKSINRTKNWSATILFTIVVFLIASCGGGSREKKGDGQGAGSAEMANHPGRKVYQSVCVACHMADGSGIPSMYPPLIQTEMVLKDKEKLIDITLNGLSGKIEVNGKTYNNIMPPHSHLSDKQIADVLTYVRKSFGNNASEVTVEEVQKVRNR